MLYTYGSMDVWFFFNRVELAQFILAPESIPSVLPQMDDYVRMLAINFGLDSLLQVRTPREMIEGYNAPLYETLSSLGLVKGGDKTRDPFLALNSLPTRPLDNHIALYTGESEYNMTRTYGGWMDQGSIMMNGTQYATLHTVENITFSPWAEPVPINGTDGL